MLAIEANDEWLVGPALGEAEPTSFHVSSSSSLTRSPWRSASPQRRTGPTGQIRQDRRRELGFRRYAGSGGPRNRTWRCGFGDRRVTDTPVPRGQAAIVRTARATPRGGGGPAGGWQRRRGGPSPGGPAAARGGGGRGAAPLPPPGAPPPRPPGG